jgi:hypothetical protein
MTGDATLMGVKEQGFDLGFWIFQGNTNCTHLRAQRNQNRFPLVAEVIWPEIQKEAQDQHMSRHIDRKVLYLSL